MYIVSLYALVATAAYGADGLCGTANRIESLSARLGVIDSPHPSPAPTSRHLNLRGCHRVFWGVQRDKHYAPHHF